MTEDVAYLIAALAFFPLSHVLLRLLVVAALWRFADLLPTPEPSDSPGSARTRDEWRREQDRHTLHGSGAQASPTSYRSSL